MSKPKLFSRGLTLTLFMVTGCGGPSPSSDEPTPSEDTARHAEWMQWRGPGGMGISPETDLPVHWSDGSANILWRTDVPGSGNSQPVVVGDRVILTTSYPTAEDASQHHRSVVAFDFATGAKLWDTVIQTAPPEKRHQLNTSAAPTPASDGEHLYVYFGAVLAKLDLDGNVVWNEEIDPDYAKYTRYAIASSPVLYEDIVIVVQDQERGGDDDIGWIAAFKKSDAERIWRHEWDHTCCSYSTPLLVPDEAGTRMFFAHSGAVSEYDLATGEPLWTHDYRILQMVPSITIDGDLLCIAGGAHNVRGVTCLRLSGRGRETAVEVVWQTNQGAPETASPILYDGLLYTVSEKGVLTCTRVADGERLWRRRLGRGRYHNSMVAGDGKIYVPNARGLTTVVVAGEPRILAENELSEGGNSTPAIAGGSLFLRTKKGLYRIEKGDEPPPSPPVDA